ncbi:HAD hydrolase-like protein [Sphingobium boeckii]|uniref:phosphoglycolate phosphatase n=1 Tax=Sphingobium boeckii TaxID=1082345 RepID=A0A7W9AH83_9SPHN|nr:HAD hydrolase-like protein [Sphingobium boeckii]MBB5685528.1 phosphoglycolate phosphatase [Sphingobium boeckii]
MSDFPFAVIGFDLDGTLLDTSRDLADAVNHALDLAGRPLLTVNQIKPMIGGGAKKMLEHGLNATGGCEPEEMKRLYRALLDFYEDNLSNGTLPFPGLLDAMSTLDARSVRLAVCTNKFEHLAVKLLTELDLIDRFACVIGGDTMGKGHAKPSAVPIHEMIARSGGGRAAFVGDSIFDTMAAKNAGIPSVAVSFGFLLGPVEALEADAVIDHYDELIPALERLGG